MTSYAPLGLWQAIFGDEEGYLCVASGSRDGERLRDFRERYFRWPERAQDALGYVRDEDEAEREVYFCAHLLTEERRAKATAAPIRALYADGDGAEVPESVPEPSVVVESSPGRTQLFWLLTSPVEPEVAELLNRRIARAVGADMSGWDLTQLLRVPGTRNRKYADAPEVSITETTGELHDPEELDRNLSELPDGPGSVHDGELPKPVSPPMDDEEIIGRCRRARNGEKFAALYDDGELSEYGGDHSGADFALVNNLGFYTQDPEKIDRLFRKSALMRPKWDEKRGASTYGGRTVSRALAGRTAFYGAAQDFGEVVMVDDVREGERHGVLGGVPDIPSHTVRDDTGGDNPRALARRGVFPVEVLPPVLRRMTEEVSREMNVPPEYFVAPALATLAVAIGGTRYLNVFGSWSVLGNLSAATVAESADKKTPPYKMAIAPAMKLQKEYFREYKLGKEEYEEKYRRWEMEKKNTPKEELPPPPPEEPKLENVVAHDFTSEALADVLNDTPRGVLITDDELAGFFNGLDQYKSGGRGNERQRHLKIMSNTSFTVRRRGGDPVLVEDPVASYTGNIQPDVLPAMLIPKPGGRKGDADDGMLHRWLFAFPPPVDTVDSLEEGKAVTPAAGLQYDFLYKKLRDLDFDESGEPRRVEFTPEAFEKFNRDVYEEWQRRKNSPGLPRLLRSSYGKMADHTARIALVLALCRDPDANTGRVVGTNDVEGAAAIAEYFAVQMHKVQDALRREKESKDERYLRVLNNLLDEHGDRWRVASAKLHALLHEGGVYDIPDRTTEMTTELSALADRTEGITVETDKRVGEENARGVEIIRDTPAPASSRPGGMSRTVQDGSQDAHQDTGGPPMQKLNAEELILFALDRFGRAYPKDLAEVTERRLKTVKNALTKLHDAGKIEYTGNENEDGAKEVRLKSSIAVDDGPKDFFDPTRGYK